MSTAMKGADGGMVFLSSPALFSQTRFFWELSTGSGMQSRW